MSARPAGAAGIRPAAGLVPSASPDHDDSDPLTVALADTLTAPWGMDEAAGRLLLARCRRAARRAERSRRVHLASVTVALGGQIDPSAVVMASRRPGERWLCFEQPDRDGAALAALGSVAHFAADGEDRFERAARAWRELIGRAECDPPDGVPGAGLVAVGGFSFAPAGGGSAQWQGFSPADLNVPALSIARRGGEVELTLTVRIEPGDDPADSFEAALARVRDLRQIPPPLLDPDPSARPVIASSRPPGAYESAVAQAVAEIRAGDFEKVVLAREVVVRASAPHDAAAVFGVLRSAFSSCYVFCAGVGDAAFVAASPELLVRREGMRAQSVALAGSTRRSADPDVDALLGEQLLASDKNREEQRIVVRQIARALKGHVVWVTAPEEPSLIKVANIQHLATPIRAQLIEPLSVVELAGLLHPTPAVGGAPHEAAVARIPALEALDRGWYAGTVGWMDSNEDGEFCVALRCALLRGEEARLFAGVGVVRDSDPAAELAETEVKLGALLPVLYG